ncbi:MAG: prolipoprotein diacylglyceryl transferase [Cryomorphaceae bacterium]|nr:prolipoprotein diacylglyceryl transferase [Cryomorphaceae bacterium]
MPHTLLTYTWDFSQGLDIGFFTLRYYSLLFALGFLSGYYIVKRIFEQENIPIQWLDSLLTYVVVATIIGARLGHVFFYEWSYYSQHPGEILKVWEGGLASHGAAVAIILALIIFSRKVSKMSVLWVLDRAVITIALAGCFIRMGNMANSEIYGAIGNSSIETVYLQPTKSRILRIYEGVESVEFEKTDATQQYSDLGQFPIYNMRVQFMPEVSDEYVKGIVQMQIPSMLSNQPIDNKTVVPPKSRVLNDSLQIHRTTEAVFAEIPMLGVPRYPTQVIEALAYLLIFILLYTLFYRTNIKFAMGRIFGLFLITIFGFRFFVEFFKANQVAFEQQLQLNMGQYLSIPLVLLGIFFVLKPTHIDRAKVELNEAAKNPPKKKK